MPWAPKVVRVKDVFTNGECWSGDLCEKAEESICQTDGLYMQFTLTPVDCAKYGFKDIPVYNLTVKGFNLPFIPRVEKSPVIYCDSFESCPVQ